jgi:hypothetical protein
MNGKEDEMKNSIALALALALALLVGLAGCSTATSPAWQAKAGSVAYQTPDSGQSLVPPGWYGNDPAMSPWYTPPYFTNENPGG